MSEVTRVRMVSPKGVKFNKNMNDEQVLEAKKNGYQLTVDLVSPKGVKFSVGEMNPKIKESLQNGYKLQAQVDAENKKINIGKGETLARGVSQGVTLGFADELSGGLNALKDAYKKGSLADFKSDYTRNRDTARSLDQSASDQNPFTYGAGNVAGSVPLSLAIPFSSGIKGAALGGATFGAATGLGSSQADLTKGEFLKSGQDAALGGAIGGTLGGAIGGSTKLVSGLLKKRAAELAAENQARQAANMAPMEKRSTSRAVSDFFADGLTQANEGAKSTTAEIPIIKQIAQFLNASKGFGKGALKGPIIRSQDERALFETNQKKFIREKMDTLHENFKINKRLADDKAADKIMAAKLDIENKNIFQKEQIQKEIDQFGGDLNLQLYSTGANPLKKYLAQKAETFAPGNFKTNPNGESLVESTLNMSVDDRVAARAFDGKKKQKNYLQASQNPWLI